MSEKRKKAPSANNVFPQYNSFTEGNEGKSMDWISVRKSIKWLIGIPVSMVLEDLAVNAANSASKPRFLSFFSRSSCLISLSLSSFLSRYSISRFLLPIKPPFHHFPFFLLRFLLPRFLSLGLIQFNFCRSRESISNELGAKRSQK